VDLQLEFKAGVPLCRQLEGALRELPDRRLGYANHCGVAELRNAVAGYLARVRGVVVEPDQFVVRRGSRRRPRRR
jgi:DNA-binding transcriptional MocR family regulator